MIRRITKDKMGKSELGWLSSIFHFSFAEYFNPNNMNYGVLRVLNDDQIQPHAGFETHPHRDMEIITYVIEGELTHQDSMQNKSVLHRGDVQYMSAGTGVLHSEMNESGEMLRLMQIWILPDKEGHTPQYGEKRIPFSERLNRLLPIASGREGAAPIAIHQDLNLFAACFTGTHSQDIEIALGRQAYLAVIEGELLLNGVLLSAQDAAEISFGSLRLEAKGQAHFLYFEMAEEEF